VNASVLDPPDPTDAVWVFPSQLLTVEVLRRPIESTEYTSSTCTHTCQRLGLRRSMSRTGSCLDNAVAEAWFASLKVELVDRAPLPNPRRGPHRDLRLDRLVQPIPAALHPWLPATHRVGTPARHHQPATIDHGRITPVSTSRGEVHTRSKVGPRHPHFPGLQDGP
jgi:transposase InsO family protein